MEKQGKQFQAVVGGKVFTFETGKLAGQANGAVTVRLGDSMIFCAATMGAPREGLDFFPMTVEYEERMYAGGRIPGSFFRREGRPSSDAILTARLTDRPLRPLFDKNMRNDIQIINMSLSSDNENPLDILVVNASSAALHISDIPWGGPVAAVRIGLIDGEFIVNPSYEEIEYSDLDLRIAGTRDAILMVECGANEVPEDIMVRALSFGHEAMMPLIDVQEQMRAEIGKPKAEIELHALDEALVDRVYARAASEIAAAFDKGLLKAEVAKVLDELQQTVMAEFVDSEAEDAASQKKDFGEAYEKVMTKVVRDRIINQGIRPDGRTVTQVRPIWCEVGASPRAHGSGIFTRGETQAFTLATLGTPRDAQEVDNLGPTESKRYMHHYNFPPFSTGEAKPLRGSSRREIGHGALAERALVPVIPSQDDFPYTMRVVSEIMSSNGSSSMASVCGSTLALMDAGVPIKAPVSGVAMGLIKEGDAYKVLTDIQGIEDHLGDMDFKVTGTEKGITALQMDIKIKGLTAEIMSEALDQAKEARAHILAKMLETIPAPNPELKEFAPRITTVKIPVDKIGALIGPGGKNIRALQEETNTTIDIEEDGTVFIAATNGKDEMAARERIEMMTETPEVGHIYTGKVVRTTDFGAFVQILPGMDGMVHISQLDSTRVNSVEDVCRVGDELTVMVTNIDPDNKIRLSRVAVLEGWSVEEAQEKDKPNKKSGGGRDSRGGRDNRDRGGNRDNRGGRNFSNRN
ncbi:MAG: polyribonucleotide nucleotidyltransferase [Anaerolineae bacterium]|nr:polyribonucleotide nucleotidyltransferase [Anaerolineae bacterium]